MKASLITWKQYILLFYNDEKHNVLVLFKRSLQWDYYAVLNVFEKVRVSKLQAQSNEIS